MKKQTKRKPTKKKPGLILYNFDSIKLNNPALLNDQSINVAYQEFIIEIDDAFNTFFSI